MRLPPFKLEQFFARYEFSVRHLLCASDVEGVSLGELVAMADAESRELWEALTLGYSDARGHPLLRARIARDYDFSPEQVLVANPQEAIFLCMHALLEPGDHVVAAWPAYQSLHEVARSIGARVTLLPIEELAQLETVVTERTKLVVLNTPNNPSGTQLSATTLRHVVEVADAVQAHVFCDEVYRFLEHDPRDRLPPAATLSARAISFSALSKAYGLAGLRIGWLATRDTALLARVHQLKDFTSICNSRPSEVLGCMALSAREALVGRALAIVHESLRLYGDFFTRHADRFELLPPRAGSTALVRDKQGSCEAFVDRLARDAGVLLLPASVFDMSSDYFRIGLGRRHTAAGLAAFDAFLTAG